MIAYLFLNFALNKDINRLFNPLRYLRQKLGTARGRAQEYSHHITCIS